MSTKTPNKNRVVTPVLNETPIKKSQNKSMIVLGICLISDLECDLELELTHQEAEAFALAQEITFYDNI